MSIDQLPPPVATEAGVDYGLVTALPSSPQHGDTCVLTDSLATPTFRWQFIYNELSSSAHKWEFIGGPHRFVMVGGAGTRTSTAYGDCTTGTTTVPSVSVPVDGNYLIDHGAFIQGQSSVLGDGFASLSIAGGGVSDADAARSTSTETFGGASAAITVSKPDLSVGDTVAQKYRSAGSGPPQYAFMNRWIKLAPTRVG